MTIQVDAVFQGGVLLPKQPVALPDGTEVTIAIIARGDRTDPLVDVLGIGEGPESGDASDHHDNYLYEAR
jgi:predicted DNA-binding antitoxin AbrB/MazE fold protein